MTPWFIATKRFTPRDGKAWTEYINWSGLSQLEELVSLDGMLCPTLLPEIQPDDWPYIVQEDFMLQFFLDFEFLSKRVAAIQDKNLLCVFRNPEQLPVALPLADFECLGFDLVDTKAGASALSNCGGFPDVFANSELSCYGLLPHLERAADIQKRLRLVHPEEAHANCHVWAIFRALATSATRPPQHTSPAPAC
jgi:hypothetical protein